MRELVSKCHLCGKDLYCIDGFFNGIHSEEQETLCFDCADEKEST